MTETARTEREKIVAYLRRLEQTAAGRANALKDGPEQEERWAQWAILGDAADAIEAGEHFKKPEPSILASEWVKEPSVGH